MARDRLVFDRGQDGSGRGAEVAISDAVHEFTSSAATSSIDRSFVCQRARTLHIVDQIGMRGRRHRSLLLIHLQLLEGVDELLHRFFHELQVAQA